jgi:hypothetical protein
MDAVAFAKWLRKYFESWNGPQEGWVLFDHSTDVCAGSRNHDGIKVYSEEDLYHIFSNDPVERARLEDGY